MRALLVLSSAILLLASCGPGDTNYDSTHHRPALESHADSVAYRLVEASGGFEAWEALPSLQFSFGFESDGTRSYAAHHLWDRRNNRYRVEWPDRNNPDNRYVALFSDWPDEGSVFLNGEPVETIGDSPALAAAQRRTINDTYWLLAPLKVFDPGVTRTAEPDSSDAAHDVVRLSFEDVGITPGDRYWLFVERDTGRLARWTYALQGGAPPRSHRWIDYQALEGPRGPVTLASRKVATIGGGAILTDRLAVPDLDETLFEDRRSRWLGTP
jgi:hypothetical protein